MEDFKQMGAHLRFRPWLAGGAVVLGAMTAVGCGDSSDDNADAPAAKAAATTKAAKPASAGTTAAPTTAATPAPPSDVAKKFIAQGTVRLMAKRLGYPGTLAVVGPKGIVDKNNERWYKVGTEVTLRAGSTKTAHFAGWSMGCTSKALLCKVKIQAGDYTRVFATFTLDKKAAKHLKKSDPALQSGIFPDGSGPPKS